MYSQKAGRGDLSKRSSDENRYVTAAQKVCGHSMNLHSWLSSAVLMLGTFGMLTGFSAVVVAMIIRIWGSDE
jgi:hypothetical protein